MCGRLPIRIEDSYKSPLRRGGEQEVAEITKKMSAASAKLIDASLAGPPVNHEISNCRDT
jgi:hypothetical protein